MLRTLGLICIILISPAAFAADVSLIAQGQYVERGPDGTLDCTASNRMQIFIQLESRELLDLGATQMERVEVGSVMFDTGAGEFMEVTVEQAVIAFTPMTRSIAIQGEHISGGKVHFNGQVLGNGDLDIQSARRLEGESDLTQYIIPTGDPVQGQRPDGSPVGVFGYCSGN